MTKYTDVITDVEKQFATTIWKQGRVQAYPSNYQGGKFASEFVKIEVLPARSQVSGYATFGVAGQAIIQIYVPVGKGVRRIHTIADRLDRILQNVSLANGTKLGTSSLSVLGIDNDDKSLFRADYNVNFVKYN